MYNIANYETIFKCNEEKRAEEEKNQSKTIIYGKF